MPPRSITLGIVAVWLAAVGWMGYREWWRPATQPPLLDRSDEVGRQIARWRYHVNGQDVSSVQLSIHRDRGDRLFTLAAKYNAKDGFYFHGLMVKRLKTDCRTTPKGELRELSYDVELGLRWLRREVRLEGKLDGEHFTLRVVRGRPDEPLTSHGTAPGGLFNLLAPLHRMPDLYEGRQWQVVALDPLESALNADPEGSGCALCTLEATTTAERLDWHDLSVPCWRVDYRRAGKLRARAWARQDDGYALRQEVHYDGTQIALQRELLRDESERRFPGMPQLPR